MAATPPSSDAARFGRRARPVAFFVLALALLVSLARPARAVPCGIGVSNWAQRCSKRIGLTVEPDHCAPGLAIVSISRERQPLLEVQVERAAPDSFERVGHFGLSPIGTFNHWNHQPEERRRALALLARCITADPSLPLVGLRKDARPHSQPVGVFRPHTSGFPLLPWRLIFALVLAGAACVVALRRRAPTRRQWLTASLLVVSGIACFVFRWLLLPRAFFHQNGHGPEWVLYAFQNTLGLNHYGPGFPELFRLAAHLGSAPEAGVFLEQALLGALGPAAAWVIARRSGASALLAAAIALGVAVDPTLARISQSESYLAVGASLLFIAAALLAYGAYRARVRSPRFLLSVAAAGLVVAQLSRVHPLLWFGAACLPAVVLVGQGRRRTRVVLTLAAAAGIAIVVALTTGPTLLAVLRGPLGHQWSGPTASRWSTAVVKRLPVAVGLLVLALVFGGRLRSTIAVAALWCVHVFAHGLGATAGFPNLATESAFYRLFWPVLAAPVAALFARLPRELRQQRRLGPLAVAVVAALGLIHSARSWHKLTELPTDAREQAWAQKWREKLPAGSVVAYLSQADKRDLVLPFYRGAHVYVRAYRLRTDRAPPNLHALGTHVYYYHSSICSSKQGAAFCRRVERTAQLERIDSRHFPAIPSMCWDHYTENPVRVELFRVRPQSQ